MRNRANKPASARDGNQCAVATPRRTVRSVPKTKASAAGISDWADNTPRYGGSGFTRLAVELADLSGHPARTIARRHKAILEAQYAEFFEKAKVSNPQELAREVALLIEGAMLMMLVTRDRSYALAAAKAANKLVRLRS